MKTVYKMAIAFILCVVAITYLLSSVVKDVSKEIDNTENKYKKHIGKKHVIDKDTLTIVDYSIFNENFTLSDGRKVSYILIGKK